MGSNNWGLANPNAVEPRLRKLEKLLERLMRAPVFAPVNGEGATGSALHQGGDVFGATLVTGTNDNNDVSLRRNGREFLGLYDAEADFAVSVYATNLGSPYDYYEALSATEFAPTTGTDIAGVRGSVVAQQAGAGTLDQLAGVHASGVIGSGNAHDVNRLVGVRGGAFIEGSSSGTVHVGIGLLGEAFPNPGGGGVAIMEKAYSIFGEAQTLGTLENWSGYFDGAVRATGPMSVIITTPTGVVGFDGSVDSTAPTFNSIGVLGEVYMHQTTGTVPSESSGVLGTGNISGDCTVNCDHIYGVEGTVSHFGSGTLAHAHVIHADAISAGGSSPITDAISIYGAAQTAGINNYAGKFDGYLEVDASALAGGNAAAVYATDTNGAYGLGGYATVGGGTGTIFASGLQGGAQFTGNGATLNTVDPNSAGVEGYFNTQFANIASTILKGVRGHGDNSSYGTVVELRAISGEAMTSPHVTPARAISIYGEAQTAGAENWSGYFDGNVNSIGAYYVNSLPVVGARGALVADATNSTDVITQLNLLLSRLRTHGLIAT